MADLRKAIEVTKRLTSEIQSTLDKNEGVGSEQVVWTHEIGDIVTTMQYGEGVKFKIIGYVNLFDWPGYQLEQVGNPTFKPTYPEISLKKVLK